MKTLAIIFALAAAAPLARADGPVTAGSVTTTEITVPATVTPAPAFITPALVSPPSPVAEEKALAPDCLDVTEGMTNTQVGGIFFAALFALRSLAELLGFLAARGNKSAGAAMRYVTYGLSFMGWLAGRMGWGHPKAPTVQAMPRLASLRAPDTLKTAEPPKPAA